MGECVSCGNQTKLEFSEPEINHYGYMCGKCRGYTSDDDYVKDVEFSESEFAKTQQKKDNFIKNYFKKK